LASGSADGEAPYPVRLSPTLQALTASVHSIAGSSRLLEVAQHGIT
jgi:hypothetical protein